MTTTNFSDEITKLVRDLFHRRNEIKEEFFKAYLAEIMPSDPKEAECILSNIEMVEQFNKDRNTVSWYFRVRQKS